VTAKHASVKKYVVKLSDNEREQLNALIRTGKHRAGQLVKARILLKANASEAGEGWSDSEIAASAIMASSEIATARGSLLAVGSCSAWPRPYQRPIRPLTTATGRAIAFQNGASSCVR
jgi:hypothetical protein